MCANYKFYSNFHVISCLGIRDMHWLHSEFFLCIHSRLKTIFVISSQCAYFRIESRQDPLSSSASGIVVIFHFTQMCRRTPDPTWTEFICKKKGEQENSSLAISVPTNMIIVWRVWDWIAQIQSSTSMYLISYPLVYIVLLNTYASLYTRESRDLQHAHSSGRNMRWFTRKRKLLEFESEKKFILKFRKIIFHEICD